MKARWTFMALVALIPLILASCGEDEPSGVGATAVASMSGPDGMPMGTVTLAQGPNGVLISADVKDLIPGAHGFHIHSVGACTPDFSAAGGHFAPTDHGHGFMHPDGSHAGDLPNIYAGSDGTARADVFTDQVTLAADAETSVFDSDGSAIIIHAKPDSYGVEPGAGDRVACGVIEQN
nr:superoxide dismutase family protein [bacterium]